MGSLRAPPIVSIGDIVSTTLKKPKSPPKKVEMPATENKMAETTVEVLKKDRARRDKYVNDPWTPKKKK